VSERSFADRLTVTGLKILETDVPKLEALVKDMDRAAKLLQGPRVYSTEPLNAFRLPDRRV
jgi:hypothetical protein